MVCKFKNICKYKSERCNNGKTMMITYDDFTRHKCKEYHCLYNIQLSNDENNDYLYKPALTNYNQLLDIIKSYCSEHKNFNSFDVINHLESNYRVRIDINRRSIAKKISSYVNSKRVYDTKSQNILTIFNV
jgi:hypothetical protein